MLHENRWCDIHSKGAISEVDMGNAGFKFTTLARCWYYVGGHLETVAGNVFEDLLYRQGTLEQGAKRVFTGAAVHSRQLDAAPGCMQCVEHA